MLASPQLSGRHEDAYIALVKRYGAREGQQARPIDAMVSAWGDIQAETEQSGADVLGAVFMEHVTRGDHGQFFTPECITSLMASLAGEVQPGQQVLDPACGSGRMLLDMASKQPLAEFHGVDIDERCAMMCALNFWMRDLAGRVTWGNALTNETRKAWSVSRGGWVREVRHDEEEARPAGRLF